MRHKLLSLAILILVQAPAFADGGTVQLHQEAGPFVITLFTSPTPLCVGSADISLLLQKRDGLEPVLDADVSLVLREDVSGTEFRVRPTRALAQNKILFAAPATFSKSGRWRVAIAILQDGQRTGAIGTLDVAPLPEMAVSYWSYIAFPPLVIVIFVIRQRLVRRKAESRAGQQTAAYEAP
jgi:hypothetical protein